jgi:hypothetical protein
MTGTCLGIAFGDTVDDQGPHHVHGHGRVTERFHNQPRPQEHPHTKYGARDRVLERIAAGIATPCSGPSLPQTTQAERGTL